jgi:Carboxypeptidase regulatory-like domain
MRRTAALATFMLLAGLLAAPPANAAPTGLQAATTTTAEATPSLPTTTLTGTITDALTGAPVAGGCVIIRNSYVLTQPVVGRTCADQAGHYTLSWRSVNGAAYLAALAEAPGYFRGWAAGATGSGLWGGIGSTLTRDFAIAPVGRAQLSGRVLGLDGVGWGYASVIVYLTNGQIVDYTNAGPDGRFSLDNLPATSVKVQIRGQGYSPQWWPGQTGESQAGTLNLADGAVTSIDEQLLWPNSETPTQPVPYSGGGVVTDAGTGQPVAGATVQVATNLRNYAQTTTDADGKYAFAELPPVTAGIRVQAEGYASTWWPDDPAFGYLSALGPTFVRDFALTKGSGSLLIHLHDYDGLAADAQTSFTLTSSSGSWRFSSRVQVNGDLVVANLPPGSYELSATSPLRSAWSAGTFTVTDGATTEATATHPAPGHTTVTVVDEATGALLPGLCVTTASTAPTCTNAQGQAVVGPFWTANETATTFQIAQSLTNYAANTVAPTKVSTETTATLRVRRAAAVSTAVRGATGGWFPTQVCINVARPLSLTSGPGERYCKAPDNEGRVTFGLLPPGPMQLLVSSNLYAVQWLGPNGGTGDQRQASVVQAIAGQIIAAPDIQIAVQESSISGTIVSAATGTPIAGVCPRVVGIPADVAAVTCSDANGRYNISRLGPYAWPLVVSAEGYAVTWSGGATNRFGALYVGPPAQTVDLRLRNQGVIAPITAVGAASGWRVDVFDARTGDGLGYASAGVPVTRLNTGTVLIRFTDATGKACWVQRLSRDRLTAYFDVTAGATLTGVTVGPNCTTATPSLLTPLPRR